MSDVERMNDNIGQQVPARVAEVLQNPPVKWFGLRRSAIIETVLFLALAWALDRVLFNANGYWHVAPHPYWIIVLLVSIQYGVNEGLFAAVMASAVLLIGNIPQQSLDQDLYGYLFELTYRPLMWLAMAVIVGELRMRQIHEYLRMRQQMEESAEREKAIAEAYAKTLQVKENLELQVAGQLRSVISMYQAVRAMEQLEPGRVLFGVMELVHAVLNPAKVSIYLLSNDRLQASMQNGWEANDNYQRVIESNSPLFRAVILERRLLQISDADDEKVLARQGILAGPLINTETASVIGMLKIEDMGFTDLSWNTIKNFEVVSDWIGNVYGNARRFQDVKRSSVVDEYGKFFSAGFYQQYLQFLTALAKRQKFPLCSIFVGIENWRQISPPNQQTLLGCLRQSVDDVLRGTDLVFDYQGNGRQYAVLLPATPLEHTQLVVDKLMAGLQQCLGDLASEAHWAVHVEQLYKPGDEE